MKEKNQQYEINSDVIMITLHEVIEKMLAPVIAAIKDLELIKRKEYLTPEEVETVYSLKATTLANKRMRGIGPSYSKDGEKVLYAQITIRQYLEKRTIRTSS